MNWNIAATIGVRPSINSVSMEESESSRWISLLRAKALMLNLEDRKVAIPSPSAITEPSMTYVCHLERRMLSPRALRTMIQLGTTRSRAGDSSALIQRIRGT